MNKIDLVIFLHFANLFNNLGIGRCFTLSSEIRFIVLSLGLQFFVNPPSLAKDTIKCEIINTPIDCKRLTRQECQQAKKEQHQRNLNIQHLCSIQAVASASAEIASSGSAGGSAGGAGMEVEETESGEIASSGQDGNETNKQLDEQSMAQSEKTEDANEQQTVQESVKVSSNQTSSVSGTGPTWGTGSLCQRFKEAYEKAQSEDAKSRIQEQAKKSNC